MLALDRQLVADVEESDLRCDRRTKISPALRSRMCSEFCQQFVVQSVEFVREHGSSVARVAYSSSVSDSRVRGRVKASTTFFTYFGAFEEVLYLASRNVSA